MSNRIQIIQDAAKEKLMKAYVDSDTCIGCGLCVELCPEVFEMDGALARTKSDSVPSGAEESCRTAMDSCPVIAISIKE